MQDWKSETKGSIKQRHKIAPTPHCLLTYDPQQETPSKAATFKMSEHVHVLARHLRRAVVADSNPASLHAWDIARHNGNNHLSSQTHRMVYENLRNYDSKSIGVALVVDAAHCLRTLPIPATRNASLNHSTYGKGPGLPSHLFHSHPLLPSSQATGSPKVSSSTMSRACQSKLPPRPPSLN